MEAEHAAKKVAGQGQEAGGVRRVLGWRPCSLGALAALEGWLPGRTHTENMRRLFSKHKNKKKHQLEADLEQAKHM